MVYIYSFAVNESEFVIRLSDEDKERARSILYSNLRNAGARIQKYEIMLLSVEECKEKCNK